ncbi:hypothetical protein [Variovorax saccharolyticus]|uniref:hypothetical protein n=1 Tax=Variovorax saccharolyticus TaxID=3053516 RepID=UPI0025776DF5|nr:hypothetical protein [Variovorax sp. J31P216]MDM0026407.1 hypothetical protein [Variovorax sp. J31P216]
MPLNDLVQPTSLHGRQGRTLDFPQQLLVHVARPEEVRTNLKKAKRGFDGGLVTCKQPSWRPVIPSGKSQLLIAGMEISASLTPFVPVPCASSSMQKSFVNARVQTRNLRCVALYQSLEVQVVHRVVWRPGQFPLLAGF